MESIILNMTSTFLLDNRFNSTLFRPPIHAALRIDKWHSRYFQVPCYTQIRPPEQIFIKFDNSKHLEGLPEDMSMCEEEAGRFVNQVSDKEAFYTKLIKENVLAIEVRDFPSGTYYVHVNPNKSNKKEADKIRVVFN